MNAIPSFCSAGSAISEALSSGIHPPWVGKLASEIPIGYYFLRRHRNNPAFGSSRKPHPSSQASG